MAFRPYLAFAGNCREAFNRYQEIFDGMCVNCSLPDGGEAKRVFDALSEGGQVQMPLGETFFSPAFGMCTDRFGTPWMVMVEAPAEP